MALDILLNSILVVISILMLWKGADWLVESASRIAHSFGVSDLVIGLTVVAIGTSAPEFAVTITAALTGKANISVGNVVGSNIFNLGFILGGTAAISAIKTVPKLVYRDGLFLISVTVLLYLFLFGFDLNPHSGQLDQWEGYVMIGLLFAYVLMLFVNKEPIGEDIPNGKAVGKDYLMLLIGITGIVGGGHLLVESASAVARVFGVSDWVIGVTIVAAGTSAPEFATSLTAAIKGKHGLAIGNLIGSDLFNLLGVLGLAGVIKPLMVSASAQSSIMLLVVMVTMVVVFIRTGWQVSRAEGVFLVVINLIRWVMDFMSKG